MKYEPKKLTTIKTVLTEPPRATRKSIKPKYLTILNYIGNLMLKNKPTHPTFSPLSSMTNKVEETGKLTESLLSVYKLSLKISL